MLITDIAHAQNSSPSGWRLRAEVKIFWLHYTLRYMETINGKHSIVRQRISTHKMDDEGFFKHMSWWMNESLHKERNISIFLCRKLLHMGHYINPSIIHLFHHMCVPSLPTSDYTAHRQATSTMCRQHKSQGSSHKCSPAHDSDHQGRSYLVIIFPHILTLHSYYRN